MKDTQSIKGKIEYKIIGVDGLVRDRGTIYNLVTIIGKATLVSGTMPTYIATGSSNTTVSAGQTALGSEITTNGLQRSVAAITYGTTATTNDTRIHTVTFTISGTQAVEEIGLFTAASGPIMVTRALTTTKSFVSGESWQLVYSLIYS